MKALVLNETGGIKKLTYQEVIDPKPQKGEVLIQLKAAALNHRDLWICRGQYAGIKVPIILGSDGAGIVVETGEGVDVSWKGQECLINPSLDWGKDERVQQKNYRILGLPDNGTFAELITLPVTNISPKPAILTWEEAAAIPLAGLTAYRAVITRARVARGEIVLVTGIGGGVATFALQFAKHLGAKVFVTSGNDEKLSHAQKLGAVGGVSYRNPNWVEELAALGCHPDVIIDSAGGNSLEKSVELVKPGGRIAFYGATTGLAPNLDLRRIFFKQLDILGSTMGNPREFGEMIHLFENGNLKPVIDKVFSLSQATQAFERMEDAEQFCKLVLRMD